MKKALKAKLRPVGRLILITGAARFYRNGDGAGFVWRWWHPLAWVLASLSFLASIVIEGAPETWRSRHAIGFGMDPWFKKNPSRLEWF